jgi:hypothetical protein
MRGANGNFEPTLRRAIRASRLTLVETKRFKSGVTALRYRRA